MRKKSEPNYYAILPAYVRYDSQLEPNAKLLFAELTALSGVQGYCYSRDDYFSGIYHVTVRTVQSWLLSLEQRGYITRHGEGCNRKIYICALAQRKILKNAMRDLCSYDDIMTDCQCSASYKHTLYEFIKHCQLNGRKLTNDKLRRILIYLDAEYTSETEKIQTVQTAIDRGYYDILRNPDNIFA